MKQNAAYFCRVSEAKAHGWSCACVECGRLYMDRGGDETEWSCRDCGADVRRLSAEDRATPAAHNARAARNA